MFSKEIATLLLALLLGDFTFGENTVTPAHPDYDDYDSKILDGVPVDPPHSRPFVVQIPHKRGTMVGSIYDEWTILTSGSFLGSDVNKILAGKHYHTQYESSQQERTVCSYSVHTGGVNPTDKIFGVIHLREPLKFNEYVGKIPISEESINPGGDCWMIGWGQTSPGKPQDESKELRQAKVKFKAQNDCGSNTHSTLFCVHKGGCYYDWGAPIICQRSGKDTLVGYVYAIYEDCTNTPITNVGAIPKDWFNNEIEKAKQNCRPSPTTQPPTTSTKPTTRPPAPPGVPYTPPPDECECELRGYCRWFEICIEDVWSRRRLCSNDLYWLPNNITGGTCAHFESLPPHVQKKYKDDPDCYNCEWYQEIKDVCSPRYTFRDADGNTHAMSCPGAPSGKSQLYWQLKMKTCDECIHAVDHRDQPCVCN